MSLPAVPESRRLELFEIEAEMNELSDNWKVEESHHLRCTFKLKDFNMALAFTNQIGKIAEEMKHHPDILLTYGKVEVKIFTHKVDGLTEKDFLLANQIDAEYLTFVA